MHILIATGVFPPEGGGPATYSKALQDGLPNHGFTVDVLPFRDVRKYPKVVRHIVYFFKVLSRARRADIVYAQDPMSVGLPAACAASVLRKKFVLKIVGDYAWEQSTQRFSYEGTIEQFQKDEDLLIFPLVMRGIERWVAKRASTVVVPSKYLGRIVQKWGIPKKRITVVYNGIESERVGLKQVIRGLLKFRGKLLVSISRLVPWKGFKKVIEVHAELKKRIPDLTLLIVGTGPDAETLEGHARNLGVIDSVIFTGNVERAVALRYMKAADVFVLNTRYEGFSHLLLEAASVGVPIVTTQVGGNPEFIEDNVNGYLTKPDDTKALTHRIEKLLTSPETRARLSANAKKRVDSFSVETMVEQTAKVLKRA